MILRLTVMHLMVLWLKGGTLSKGGVLIFGSGPAER